MIARIAFVLIGLSILTYLLVDWIGSLPRMSTDLPATAISSQLGEEIFWGKGRCHVCHRVGEQGYALRGPNLGQGSEGPLIGVRAKLRAREVGLASGVDYIAQSLVQPGAFVVPGYKNEMPETFKAPISLRPGEIKSIVLYLESLGGEDKRAEDIVLPDALFTYYHQPPEPKDFPIRGDVEAGRRLFFDSTGPAGCAACHVAINAQGRREGGKTGPDLTAVAAIRSQDFILREIVAPNELIVSGYETTLIKTKQGQFIAGVMTETTDEALALSSSDGATRVIPLDQIQTRQQQNLSLMPSNYKDLLDEEQLQDLLAYLLTLKGESHN